jgi:hypothetical protein
MEPRLLLRAGIGASVIGHLMLVVGLIFAEARPFAPAVPETIAVDLVTSEEAPKPIPPEPPKEAKPPPAEKPPAPDLTGILEQPKPSLQTSTPQPPPSKPAAAEAHPPALKTEASKPEAPKSETKPEPKSASKSAPPPPPPAPAAAPPPPPPPMQQASVQPPAEASQPPQQKSAPPPQSGPPIMTPEPDVTVKYGVLLGLPEASAGDPLGGGSALAAAKIEMSDTAKFRQHLRTCSVLPAQVAPSDKVRIVLRVLFKPDGTLVGAPGLIEASASPAKGLALTQAATRALESCQPYAMLPADKYDEWKVLDLTFTPQDFTPG